LSVQQWFVAHQEIFGYGVNPGSIFSPMFEVSAHDSAANNSLSIRFRFLLIGDFL
jgi:hypothetical protein